ncbi:MAG: 16S rRNA (adenine(1518)-N(6)/adenine(1519)-N(6))-dimethyltransferase RsmA [Pseudomonadota bacterium]
MHRPRKRFGQNFLVDASTIEQLVRAIHPKSSDKFLEIGPGLGALTLPLLEKIDALEVIEIDHDLVKRLEDFKNQGFNLNIHQMDVLKFDFSKTDKHRRIVGNLPYNISTPVIFHLLNSISYIMDMHFMLQKEVVDRICAKSGDRNFGRLSVIVQSKCATTKLFEIAAEKFNPPPKVTSAFISLTPHPQPLVPKQLDETFENVVRHAFSQPRKTLANNLKLLFSTQQIEALGIDPGIRPQCLKIDELILLAQSSSPE